MTSALVLVLAAGCGWGDGDADRPDSDPAAEASERDGDGPKGQRGERPDRDPPEELDGAAGRIVDACEQIVRRAPGVSEKVKRDLIADCEAAAAGDEEAQRKAARAACDVIAAATAPAILRGQVAAACKRAIPGSSAF